MLLFLNQVEMVGLNLFDDVRHVEPDMRQRSAVRHRRFPFVILHYHQLSIRAQRFVNGRQHFIWIIEMVVHVERQHHIHLSFRQVAIGVRALDETHILQVLGGGALLRRRQDVVVNILGNHTSRSPNAAAQEFEVYLKTAPADHAAQVERASLLFDAGKLDDALAELDRAANGQPEALPALKLRANILYQKKQFSDLLPVLQKAIVLAPQDPNLQAQLGHAYLKKRDYPNAVQQLTAAMKANPSLDLLNDLVAAEYLSKNYGAALSGLDILAQHEELPFGSWFIRATCYDRLGQVPQALAAYQKFLQLNKDETSDMYFEATARARTLERELKNKKR